MSDSDLAKVLRSFTEIAHEREKGEELTVSFLENEPLYRDLYETVRAYSEGEG